MARVLVTGGSGLIGRHAVAALVEGQHDVHVFSRAEPGGADAGVQVHAVDVLDPDAVSRAVERIRPSHLLHLAWVTEHGQFWISPANEDWLAASKHLIASFMDNGGQRLVVSGSCAEYDWRALGDGICREDKTPLNAQTLYGRCKVELFDWLNAQPVSSAWGRVFFPFGLGEDERRLVPSVILALQGGREARCSSGTQVRDFMLAEDIGRAFAELLMSPVEGAINVASGEPHSIAELVAALGEISGRPDLIRLGAFPDRPDDPPVLFADVTRLHAELGFTPAKGFHDSLEAVYHQFQREGEA